MLEDFAEIRSHNPIMNHLSYLLGLGLGLLQGVSYALPDYIESIHRLSLPGMTTTFSNTNIHSLSEKFIPCIIFLIISEKRHTIHVCAL